MAVADNFDPKRPTHIIDGVQDRLANGDTAGTPIPVAEIEINDILILVESQDRTTGAVADLTDEYTIDPTTTTGSAAKITTSSSGSARRSGSRCSSSRKCGSATTTSTRSTGRG